MRSFLLSCEADEKGEILLRGDDFHYFAHVLRKKAGDAFDATLPSGERAVCEVAKVRADEMTVKIAGRKPQKCGLCRIWLLQFLPKMPKFDLIARQAAETGVERIIAVSGDFSNGVELTDSKLERARKIIKEARQQSGSPVSTEVFRVSLDGALEMTASEEKKLKKAFKVLFSEKNADDINEILTEGCDLAVAAIGCEGGFSDGEREKLSHAGFLSAHLKTNILRVETAALYGIAAVQTRLEHFSKRSAQ